MHFLHPQLSVRNLYTVCRRNPSFLIEPLLSQQKMKILGQIPQWTLHIFSKSSQEQHFYKNLWTDGLWIDFEC